jgi:hypothetical protein
MCRAVPESSAAARARKCAAARAGSVNPLSVKPPDRLHERAQDARFVRRSSSAFLGIGFGRPFPGRQRGQLMLRDARRRRKSETRAPCRLERTKEISAGRVLRTLNPPSWLVGRDIVISSGAARLTAPARAPHRPDQAFYLGLSHQPPFAFRGARSLRYRGAGLSGGSGSFRIPRAAPAA